MSKLSVCLWVGISMTVAGCGESAPNPAPQASTVAQSAARPSEPIASVAYDFFSAVLSSDRDAARAQLTDLAVRRMAEQGMDFLLPISESSQFTVGQADIIEAGMAAVDTVLTEVDAAGQTLREEITVVLRQENGRWGVMGVVTGMGANEMLDGFNFERPDQPFNAETFADSEPAGPAAPQQATRPTAEDPFRR